MSERIRIVNLPAESPIPPHECTLLVCLPLSQQETCAALEDPGRDFVRSLVMANGLPSSSTGHDIWQLYRPIAEYTMKVAESVRQRGVQVVFSATLRDFSDSVRSRRVTTLVAHWRVPLFKQEDIVDPNLFFRLQDDLKSRSILPQLEEELNVQQLRRVLQVKVNLADPNFRELIAEGLNTALLGETFGKSHRIGLETRTQVAFASARAALSEIFSGAFRGGAGIELADGMHQISELADGIPSEWHGILDLTVCNSTLLGSAVRLRARGALVLMNEDPASLLFRLALYKQVITMLARKKRGYTRCMIEMRARLQKRGALK